MPRSNKKKNSQKKIPAAELEPPPSFQFPTISHQSSNKEAAYIFEMEKKTMITRALTSSSKHGINLSQGAPNNGIGDCAFEAIVQNINERSTFIQKFPLEINQYRRIWATDMANRTLFTDFNIYSNKQWLEGWSEMSVPGTYERGIFGDLMVPGIACGVKKYLLIFNTSMNTPDDPIYIVDPRKFNVTPDTEVPVILAYNGSHYESLVPQTEIDEKMSVNLVMTYLEGRYRYKKTDIAYLLCSNTIRNDDALFNHTERRYILELIETEKVQKDNGGNLDMDQINSQNGGDNFKGENYNKESGNSNGSLEERQGNKVKSKTRTIRDDIELEDINESNYLCSPQPKTLDKPPIPKHIPRVSKEASHNLLKEDFVENLFYKLKNKSKSYKIRNVEGKMHCHFCKSLVKNIKIHFERRLDCGSQINMVHFAQAFDAYQKIKMKETNKRKNQRAKEKDPVKHKQTQDRLRRKRIETDPSKYKKDQKEAREKRKDMDPSKYKADQKEAREKRKEMDPSKYKADQKEAREKILEADKNYYKRATAEKVKRKIEKDPSSWKKMQLEAKKKKLEEDTNYYKNAVARTREKQKANTDETQRRLNFNQAVLYGPIFICSCCKRRLYENGVMKITASFKEKVEKKCQNFFKHCIRKEITVHIEHNKNFDKTGSYICRTCRAGLLKGQIPAMATINGLYLPPYEEEFHLTELENNLIAQIINFQYIYQLKKSRWAATKKQMISVPVVPQTVMTTVQQLPRLPKDANLIEVGIKRKKEYNNTHRKEVIDPNKVLNSLEHLKRSGHPYYQDFGDIESYETRCKELDETGHMMLFGHSDEEQFSGDLEGDIESYDGDDEEEDDARDINNDTIRRHQFDHNRNTCMTNNYPEMFTDENGKTGSEPLFFAPGEGSYPTNLQEEKDWDIKSWPTLLSNGKFGLHYKRKVKLTDQQYFCQRILNHDKRFSKSPGFIFGAAAYIEQKQLSSRANISFMRGQKTKNTDGATQYHLDDAFTTFEGIRNTPKYWQKVKYDMIAKLENFGPFHFFFTLSCGDSRCDENFSSFLVEKNYKVQYFTNSDGTSYTRIKENESRKIGKILDDFLREDVNESLHEMIRTNVLTASRNFHHRVEAFKKEILYGLNSPMKIKHLSYRVEFQGRGAAHIHGTIWVDIKEIEKLPQLQEQGLGNGKLSDAFRKLRDDVKLADDEKRAIVILTDMFTSCSLNPDTIHQDKPLGERIVKIIKEVNCHNCTSPCEKYGDKCKYGFPKLPLKETLVIDKNEIPAETDESDDNQAKNYMKILSDIEDILKEEDMVKEIMSIYEKGATEEEYNTNRSKRIDLLLQMAGDITYDEYVTAIKKTTKHASKVLLKRDIDETLVNNYNPEWALSWNANHDLQPVLDFFAVITYVTDYWAKPDEGITRFLREAAAILKSEPDQKKRCQQMANTFLTHRQMGEVEAYYKILPNLTLKYSSMDTIFIPSDKKELRSKFLQKIDEDDENYKYGAEVAGGRTGRFIEKPDIIDKFCRREISEKNPELEKLIPLQFGKMYDPIRRTIKEDEIYSEPLQENDTEETEDLSNEPRWKDDDDRVANFYITADSRYHNKRLPKIIKIQNTRCGEVPIYVKRNHPKAARIHKKKEDNDPHRFFLSELMLYTAYTDEEQLGANDEEKCIALYLEKKDDIQFVKSKLMPYTQGVEEARHYLEEVMREDTASSKKVGDELDPEQEKEIIECITDIDDLHPDFMHLNPDEMEFEKNCDQVKKTLRRIELKSADQMLKEARKLDKFQKKALHVAIKFAQDIMIARKGTATYPKVPFLMIHGGAGSGKSTLINIMAQYLHQILLRDGDDLDCPYILLSAYTGTAAANIEGQTLHTLFSFNFGAGFMSLSDKMRDEKRNLYRNLKVLIIDEISLVDADMLYKIDLRLREITQIAAPFGNVGIFVLGDLMQLCPVSGRFIFLDPRDSQFFISHEIDPLWKKFECINLEINHRQGEDKEYASMLNRIRIGEETQEDIEQLKSKVRNAQHRDITKERDAICLFGTNRNVNKTNNKRLKQLQGEEFEIKAITIHKTIKNFNPSEGKAGEVLKTPFQKELKLKIGAKVMLTYNVDTSDGLTNGARGDLTGIIKDKQGNISKVLVQFEKESVGREKRKQNEEICRKYPNSTPIDKVNFSFSISKSKKSVINTAMVIQFPLKLAFACTAHKIQGATIPKPNKAIINVEDTFTAAMTYVMLSRACALSQVMILNEFDESKMYPNMKALEELKRLNNISINNNLSKWEIQDQELLKVSSLNCRSLKKHLEDIAKDDILLHSDIICLNETWLERDDIIKDLQISNFELHLNSKGNGKGVATYFKKAKFKYASNVKEDYMQLTKFTSQNLDVILLYRSQGGDYDELNGHIDLMSSEGKPLLIIGDFNFCYLTNKNNRTKQHLEANNFLQLISEPTHIEGHLLDQAYLQDKKGQLEYTTEVHSKYYTDHKGIAIMLKKKIRVGR